MTFSVNVLTGTVHTLLRRIRGRPTIDDLQAAAYSAGLTDGYTRGYTRGYGHGYQDATDNHQD